MINLKPFTTKDYQTLINWIDNEKDLVRFAGTIFTFPLTTEQLNDYIKDLNRTVYKIVDETSGLTIGHSEIYLNNNTAKLCRILIGNSEYRGKGICEKIVQELVNKSFNQFKVKKVELNVYDWNIPAIKCYTKVGFKVNKEKTKATEINNHIWTAINMKIEKNE